MNARHAVYATIRFYGEAEAVTFRIGQPVRWGVAQDRYERLRSRAIRKGLRVRYGRRWYALTPILLEVRATDRHGRGLGSDRHARAIPVPYRLAKQS